MFSSLRSLANSARPIASSLLRAAAPPRLGVSPRSASSSSHPWSSHSPKWLPDPSVVGMAAAKRGGLLLHRINLANLRGGGGWGKGELFRRTGLISRSWSSFTPSAEEVVYTLVGMNIGVFMLWRVLKPSFMMENFTLTWQNIRSWRLHTLLTSAFSHMDLDHLVSNMFELYFFGISIAHSFGPTFLVKLYVSGAVGGSLFFFMHDALMRSVFKEKKSRYVYALGASGATNAIILLYIFLFPTSTIYLYFVPVPAVIAGSIMVGMDVWRSMRPNSQISGAAHIGGAAVAGLFWASLKKGWF